MTEKYLLFSLEDDKAKNLGEVIASPTARKIVNFLAEKEASESDLARELNLPLNTAEYNLKKLLEAGIIEKSKNFLWSIKGKKIDFYKVANKLLVISPKKTGIYSKLKGVVPVILISGILTGLVAWYTKAKFFIQRGAEKISQEVSQEVASGTTTSSSDSALGEIGDVAVEKAGEIAVSYPNVWIWFLIGSLIAIIAFVIWNWKKL